MVKFKDECLKEGIVVHLRTQEQCNEFSKWLDSRGKRWGSGDSYLKINNWHKYKDDTCYMPYKGQFTAKYYYNIKGYTILSYEEALLEDEEYITPKLTDLIDLDKCKDYYVQEPNDYGIIHIVVRKGLFLHNDELYCYYRNDPTTTLSSYTEFEEVKCTEEPTKELTIEEIQKELGYKIKIVEK